MLALARYRTPTRMEDSFPVTLDCPCQGGGSRTRNLLSPRQAAYHQAFTLLLRPHYDLVDHIQTQKNQ